MVLIGVDQNHSKPKIGLVVRREEPNIIPSLFIFGIVTKVPARVPTESNSGGNQETQSYFFFMMNPQYHITTYVEKKFLFAAESCICHSTTKEFSNTIGSAHQIGGGQNGESGIAVGIRTWPNQFWRPKSHQFRKVKGKICHWHFDVLIFPLQSCAGFHTVSCAAYGL